MTQAIRIYEPGLPSVMHVEEISVGTPATAQVRMRQEAMHEDIAARRLGRVPILVP